MVVAYGMIGASMSGVTFMSVPGWVGTTHFSYMMVVVGYVFGYITIATVLLPLYYRLNLTSIYSYLEGRFGTWSYKTGSFYFLLSRVIGASFRMFLVVNVLQIFVFDAYHIPFTVTVLIFIVLILLYTFKGGIKTIIWTDMIQTTFMLLALFVSIYIIIDQMGLNLGGMVQKVFTSDLSTFADTNWDSKRFFVKEILSGAFIAIVMTGLDQEMMQKNLSCRSLKDARKNMFTYTGIMVVVNFVILFLGATLYLFADFKGIQIPARTDDLFPVIAINHLGPVAGLVFLIGLISAAYPSADGALTSLTTAFSIDILGINKRKDLDERQRQRIRQRVHVGFAGVLLLVIVLFRMINNQAVIDKLFTVAGYTYGPLLGLYAFGLFTRYTPRDRWVPLIALISPVICFLISEFSVELFNGYRFGFELLILNGFLTFVGLFLVRKKNERISDPR